MKKILYLSFVFFFTISLYTVSYGQSKKENLMLTGNLHADSKILMGKYEQDIAIVKSETAEKKSPLKAGLFSLVVPGAGQFYNGDILLSAVFVVVEAALITTAVVYNNKGNNQTDFFQNFADQHWSVTRYAEWTLNHLAYLNSGLPHDEAYYESKIFPNGLSGPIVLSELNNLETDIGGTGGYSHVLPPHGEQQYYEEIGKYNQFSHGWDDANQNDTDYRILSPRYLYYSDQRGEANNLYQVSARAVSLLYINHVLSALEAVWGATRFNSNLSVNMRLRTLNLANRIEYVPTMNIIYSF